jgi:hypothetical protein
MACACAPRRRSALVSRRSLNEQDAPRLSAGRRPIRVVRRRATTSRSRRHPHRRASRTPPSTRSTSRAGGARCRSRRDSPSARSRAWAASTCAPPRLALRRAARPGGLAIDGAMDDVERVQGRRHGFVSPTATRRCSLRSRCRRTWRPRSVRIVYIDDATRAARARPGSVPLVGFRGRTSEAAADRSSPARLPPAALPRPPARRERFAAGHAARATVSPIAPAAAHRVGDVSDRLAIARRQVRDGARFG